MRRFRRELTVDVAELKGMKRLIQIVVLSLLGTMGKYGTLSAQTMEPEKGENWDWSIRTNALYDALLIPNVGVGYSWNPHWSAHLHWMYG